MNIITSDEWSAGSQGWFSTFSLRFVEQKSGQHFFFKNIIISNRFVQCLFFFLQQMPL